MVNPLEIPEKKDSLNENALLKDRPDIRAQLEDLEAEVEENPGPELEKMSEKELLQQVDDIHEGTLAFLKEKIKKGKGREKKLAKLEYGIYKDTTKLFKKLEKLVDQEDVTLAKLTAKIFLNQMMKRMKKAGLDDEQIAAAASELQDLINAQTAIAEATVGKPHMFWGMLSSGLELIPFVSGPKMLVEAVIGKTMSGRKLSASKRLLHIHWAGVWTVVDAAGVVVTLGLLPETLGAGSVAAQGGVLALKGAKVTKTAKLGAALLKGTKGGSKAARGVLKTSRFIVKHPKLMKGSTRISRYGDYVDNTQTAIKVGKGAKKIATTKSAKRINLLKNLNKEKTEFFNTVDQVFAAAA